ncbi:LuxR C-terminal-related transcriptional regulator [Subtercola sp. PAMC28395]|uniref:helix-turn-helix transcriptional regulator n=1 Tax=Subtercola sp. PAMC28395 TaxID=2846775 RepID=UPI001C0BAEAE|nr:LuxR family transcriptional regulator [Subtercola sp. PAMC28395]QWT23394.1 LuxR C-terminal-related transcriptional regulator [Subtercola sp. PAMC28395]
MNLIGRQTALSRIVSVGQQPEENAVVVYGGPGLGRTSLLESARPLLPMRSVLVRANPSESEIPLSGLSLMIANLGDSRLAEFTGRFTVASGEKEHLFAAANALLSLLRGLSLDPVVVLLDDADRMDEESQVIVGFMSTRLTSTGIRLVLSLQELPVNSPFAGLSAVALNRLNRAESERLFTTFAGPDAEPGTRQIVCDFAEGNPVSLTEIVQSLTDEQLKGESGLALPFRPGPRMLEFARNAIAGIDEKTMQILKSVSTAPLVHLESLIGDNPEATDAIDDLVSSRLVHIDGRYVLVSDPLVRSGLYWGMKSGQRREEHALLAHVNRESDPVLACWHESWSIMGSTGPGLLEGAAALATEGFRTAAVEFVERALLLRHRTQSSIEEMLGVVRAFVDRGDLELVLRYCALGLSASIEPTLALALFRVKVIATFLLEERIAADDVWAHIETADVAQPSIRVEINELCATAGLLAAERGETAEANRYLAKIETDSVAGDALIPGQDPCLTVGASDGVSTGFDLRTVVVRALGGTLEPRLPSFLSADAAELQSDPIASQLDAARALTFAEHHDDARRIFSRMLIHAPESASVLRDTVRIYAAENDIAAGHFDQAGALVDQLNIESRVMRLRQLLLQTWCLTIRGKSELTGPLIAECLTLVERDRNPVLGARFFANQGTTALMRGEVEQAVDEFDRVRAFTAELPFTLHPRYLPDLIEATVRGNSPQDALDLLAEFDEQRARTPMRWSLLAAARARAIVAPDDRAIAAYEEALALFTPADSPYELGRTLLNYASRLDRISGPEQGNSARARAHHLFGRIGAPAWTESVVRPQRVAQPPPEARPDFELNDNELAIVHMIQRGFRNKEIAARLYISLRTVEVRLTQIYRKTGANSRTHLLALLTHYETQSELVSPTSALSGER